MKRRKTILCTILVLLAVSLAGLLWWQRDNLKAVHAATQHTSDELEEKLEENRQMIEEAVRSASEVTVREVTEEERQALRDGSMTQEQLMERLTGSGGGEPSQPDAESAVPASRPESGGKTDAAPETPDAAAAGEKSEQSAESSYQKELSALIAKVYVLREEYTLALDTMYADADAAKQKAADLEKEYADHLQSIKDERDAMLREATARAQKREEEIVGEARAEAASIRAAAEADIAQERKKAVNDLKNEIGGMAVEIAGKVVEREINESDHQALIDEFIRNVGDAS